MTFLSPEDDFKLRTLDAIRGSLAKLAYIVQLRDGDSYQHWGMMRTHGESAAREAVARSHTQVFVEVLVTPLEQLMREAGQENAAETEGQDGALAILRRRMRNAVPADTDGATAAHLNFVLESLSLAERSRRASIRRAA